MICDDKGLKLSANSKDEFMPAGMLTVVIYHNYIIWHGVGSKEEE